MEGENCPPPSPKKVRLIQNHQNQKEKIALRKPSLTFTKPNLTKHNQTYPKIEPNLPFAVFGCE